MRLQQSFVNLNCQTFGLQNDVSTTVDGNGVVVAACFLQQVNAVTAGAGNPTAGMKVCPVTTATATATPTASGTASPVPTSTPITTPVPTPTGTGTAGTQPGGNAGTADRHHRHWWY